MALYDVYELIDEQVQLGQKCLNVYFYENNNAGFGGLQAQDLVEQWIDQFLPVLLPAQSAGVEHTNIRARNLYDSVDNYSLDVSEVGQSTGTDSLPNFTAVAVTLSQVNGSIRNGSKRFVGLTETDQTNGVITRAQFLLDLADLMDALSTYIFDGVSSVWQPVVVKRILDGGVYRLPENQGEAVLGGIAEALFSTVVTSQVSRKLGVGI